MIPITFPTAPKVTALLIILSSIVTVPELITPLIPVVPDLTTVFFLRYNAPLAVAEMPVAKLLTSLVVI